MVPYENYCLFAYLGLVSGRRTHFIVPAIVLNFFIIVCCNLPNPLPNVSFCSDDTAYQFSPLRDRPFLVGFEAFINRFANKTSANLDHYNSRYGSYRQLLYPTLLLCGDVQSNPGAATHGCDSKLVWICNRCSFSNFSKSFLLTDYFSVTVSNSFGSLFSSSSPGPLLHSSSPTSSAPPRRKPAKRKLKVMSLNCNRLKCSAKRCEFQSYIELHHRDIILECESKLDADIPTYWIFHERYNIFCKDRSSSGGGVFIAVRNDLVAVEGKRFDVEGYEVISVSVNGDNNH